MTTTTVLTRDTVAAAHAKQAFCGVCRKPTMLAWSTDTFLREGTDRETGARLRGVTAVCSVNKRHPKVELAWAAEDALEV